jgi:hypothetical protein
MLAVASCSQNNMIIVNLKGGLGNQMFQYACGRSLALRNGDRDFLMSTKSLADASENGDAVRAFALAHFNIKARIAGPQQAEKLQYPLGVLSKLAHSFSTKILRRFHVGFEPKILTLRGNIFLDGYFQSEKYFVDVAKVIREDFLLKTPLSPIAGDWHAAIDKDESAVSVHIRRSDYLQHPEFGGICTSGYYTLASQAIKSKVPNPHYYIFSDDIEWVKANITLDGEVHFVSSPQMKDYEELTLMSSCKHHIIANSSFSWWGAWLNSDSEKIVIAPKQWANKHEKSWYKDIIPSGWQRV